MKKYNLLKKSIITIIFFKMYIHCCKMQSIVKNRGIEGIYIVKCMLKVKSILDSG